MTPKTSTEREATNVVSKGGVTCRKCSAVSELAHTRTDATAATFGDGLSGRSSVSAPMSIVELPGWVHQRSFTTDQVMEGQC